MAPVRRGPPIATSGEVMQFPSRTDRPSALRLGAAVLVALPLLLLVHPVSAGAVTQPATVTLIGDLQSELGCSGDFQADCAATQLTYDPTDDVWQGTFTVPAGQWQ